MSEAWNERKKSLEEAFFSQRDQDLLERLRKQYESADQVAALQAVSGLQNRELLQKLVDCGIGPGAYTALMLTPLVEVAWPDGQVEEKECTAILKAAESHGVQPGTAAREWLERLLRDRPAIAVIAAWKDYVREVCRTLTPELRAAAKHEMVQRCTKVAEAAGGILGFNKISATETAVIDDLARAYDG
jgi:hypothetical protein